MIVILDHAVNDSKNKKEPGMSIQFRPQRTADGKSVYVKKEEITPTEPTPQEPETPTPEKPDPVNPEPENPTPSEPTPEEPSEEEPTEQEPKIYVSVTASWCTSLIRKG